MIDKSLWREFEPPGFPSRKLPKEVDVVVIGAGMTGLTAAYLLKKSGKRVAVFERDRIGSGESGNTSAHLTYVTDVRLAPLSRRFGEEAAALAWHGGETAINLIETIVEECRIDCGFQRVPNFIYESLAGDSDEAPELRDEAELAQRLGFNARFHPAGPIEGLPAVSYADQALFHPRRYLAALARAIDGDGCMVCEESEVGEVIDDPMAVIVNGENVACGYVVIATHVPLMGITGLASAMMFQTKLFPYSSYVLGARLPASTISPGLFSDTSDPYYYLRVHDEADGQYAVFGGEDHKTGQEPDTESHFARVEEMLARILPDAEVERRWSGQVIDTSDGLPFIGETAKNQFVGTGYSGNGMTFGTLAGIMAHDAAMEIGNPWRGLFDPNRKEAPAGVAKVITEGVDYPYYYLLDRLKRRGTSAEEVKPGEGKVLTIGGKKVACSRSDSGELTKVSAVCTHMGCIVRWNSSEQTWDCPCHGSRFTAQGLVIGGPAEEPLEKL